MYEFHRFSITKRVLSTEKAKFNMPIYKISLRIGINEQAHYQQSNIDRS